MNVRDKVYNYKTKHKEGFTSEEYLDLLKDFPSVNMDKFYNAMFGNTCMMRDGDVISYHCDIIVAINCGLENRDVKPWEFD